MPSLDLRPAARADLRGIWHYSFQTWSREQADRYVSQIRTVVSELAAQRRRGRPVPDWPDLTRCPAGSHYIYYRWTDTGLEVIRILHQRMDPDRHL